MWQGARGTVRPHGMSRERQAVGSHPVATDLSCAMAASSFWGAGLSALTMPCLLGNTWLPCMHKRDWAQCLSSVCAWSSPNPGWDQTEQEQQQHLEQEAIAVELDKRVLHSVIHPRHVSTQPVGLKPLGDRVPPLKLRLLGM